MASTKRDTKLTAEQQQALRAALPPDAPDLGAIDAVFRRRKAGPGGCFALGGMSLVFAIILFVLGVTKEPESNDRVPLFILTGIFFVGALAGAVCGVVFLRNPSWSAPEVWLLCADGLLRHQGEDVDAFPWDKLKIRKTKAHPLGRRYELSGHGGDGPVTLKCGFLGLGLIHGIEKAQVRRARPGLVRAINAGETVKFGKLGVNSQGLVYRKEVLPWENVKSLDFSFDQRKTQQLFLTVAVRGGADVNLNASEDLPNIWLFMEVVSKVHPRLERCKDAQDSWLL